MSKDRDYDIIGEAEKIVKAKENQPEISEDDLERIDFLACLFGFRPEVDK